MPKIPTALRVVLGITVLDTSYLSWRYLVLRSHVVTPGTGLCSWTAGIDCDKVLMTPQARAFWVPNAILGFGFYFGCLLWLELGLRLAPAYRHHVMRTLTVWLGVAFLFTLVFWWLLLHLPALCPFCPWNHVLSTIALVLVWRELRSCEAPNEKIAYGPLVRLVAICVGQFALWLVLWATLHGK